MSDKEVLDTNRDARRGILVVAWLALNFSLLASLLALAAYERTGAGLDQRIEHSVEEASESIEQSVQRTEETKRQ